MTVRWSRMLPSVALGMAGLAFFLWAVPWTDLDWTFLAGWLCWPAGVAVGWLMICTWSFGCDLLDHLGFAFHLGGRERAMTRRAMSREMPDRATDHGWITFFPICWGTYDMRHDGGPWNRWLQVGFLTMVRVPRRRE